jgi:hypothetical protein
MSWFCDKIRLKGVKVLKEVPFLRALPGSVMEAQKPPLERSAADLAPAEYALQQNYPNPFNPTTTIQFDLPEQAYVTLKIYNLLGQEVSTLVSHELMDDGEQEVDFDANYLPSGVYFYRIVAQGILDEDTGTAGGSFTSVKKMVLVK